MPSLYPPPAPGSNPPSPRVAPDLRTVLLLLFLTLAALLALTSLGIGALVWWRASRTWDYRERWSGTWLLAILGGLAYVLILWFGHPLPAPSHALLSATWLGRLWLLNMLLAPSCALVLEGLHPMTKRVRPLPRHPLPPTKQTGESDPVLLTLQPLQRAPVQSGSSVQSPPLEPLGTYLGGDLYEWICGGQLCISPAELTRHGVVIGEPGYGKTMTLLRLATMGVHYGMQVIYLDLKGSKQTATQFVAALHALGAKRIKVYPKEAYDGWRGDANALYNRLMSMIDPGTHPYYYKLTSSLVSLAVHAPGGPPRGSQDFLARLDAGWLKRAYAGSAHWYAQRKIRKLAPHLADLSLTYDGFFDGLAGGLDGTFAFEDADAVYIGLDGDALKEQAASMGRYLLEDCAHYAKHRKPHNYHALTIIDEFGVLKASNITDLYERVREPGMSLFASAQSYQGLGSERASVLAASSIKIMHRCGDPEEVVKFAGQREVPAFSQFLDGAEDDALPPTGSRYASKQRTAVRMQQVYAVPIEDVQQLAVGSAALITGGRGAWVQVYPVALPADLLRAATAFITAPPAIPPSPIAPPAGQSQPKKAQRQAASPGKGQGRRDGKHPPLPPQPKSIPPQVPPPPVPPRSEGDTTKTAGLKPEEGDDSPVDFFS